jgi:hypothetical protein
MQTSEGVGCDIERRIILVSECKGCFLGFVDEGGDAGSSASDTSEEILSFRVVVRLLKKRTVGQTQLYHSRRRLS